MKKFLVASDLSVRSDRALERAIRLARQHEAALTVLHVIDDDLPAPLVARLRESAAETLGEVLKAQDAPENAEVRIEAGDAVVTISETAEAVGADLVILGIHRPRAFWDMLSGTTMERIVRALRCPVLLVSEPVTGPYRSVLCGIDLSPASETAARTAAALAPEADYHSYHAVHVPYRGLIAREARERQIAPFLHEAEDELAAWLKQADLPEALGTPEILTESVETAFETMRKKTDCDLFAIGAHGRTPLSPTLLGRFTQDHIRQPVCDTLVVRG
ncbi:universal stress protein [Celeribacter indicus]|uniref:UspA domain-containing protein n=1 Tax=Celeribacter indicus TaxID=1208324 RepID=A0A0B5E4P5_9RHOB|nr:universal stress protein [Celeribacter indicus]AJE47342.1 UspA domain-containing protein [Celeribacter indicus]SDW03998.1 Nucleotide-binding universal stress protein, UspA family [Celeribacter indicus]